MDHLTILNLSESLDLGESLRSVCPNCNGKDATLSVTHTADGAIVYHCFRASCDTKGVIGGSRSQIKRITTQMKPTRKVWEGDTVPLPEDCAQWIQRKWGIVDPPHWYYTEDLGGRVAMSIRSPKDSHRGWVLRNDGSRQPKALTYLNDDELQLSWYYNTEDVCTVVVEDIPSAVRASAYVNAVSLLGTVCGLEKALELRESARGTIVIALDQDATDQALALQKTYSLLWEGPRVLPLKQDLKDMGEADLCHLLEGLKN